MVEKIEKKCFKCKCTKSIDEFYSHFRMKDGYLNKCKECAKKDGIVNRGKNIDYYREYDIKRFANDPNRKESHRNCSLKYSAKYPEKKLARNKARMALLSGKIKKGLCECCGTSDVQMHHPDYSKPLQIMWLCKICHEEWHKKYGDAK